MKRSKQCPKCESLRIGFLAHQVDADELTAGRTTTAPTTRALGAASERTDTGFWGRGKVHELIGTLEAYVCADCGYHETYVADPHAIRWDDLRGFTWVNPPAPEAGPFR